MSKREEDLRYIHGKLRMFEEHLASLRVLTSVYKNDLTLAGLEHKLELEIDNLEYCLRRDRINNHKPE